jgi:hypothetical protein
LRGFFLTLLLLLLLLLDRSPGEAVQEEIAPS